jgi:hypothetical protein
MNKYKKWYSQITQNGKTSKDEGDERHHIVPRSLGGNDDPQNIAFITSREHFVCHWLLTKIYPSGEEHWKMINAFRMMRAENPNQQRYSTKITSRVYENLKKEYAQLQSERVAGENNPMYGDKFYRSDDGKQRQKDAITGVNNGAKQENARQKISQSKLGKKREQFSDEWKAKMSASKIGKNNNRYGVTVSEDTKQKIREKAIGRKQSAETIQKKADAIRGKVKPKKLCPHCGQMTAVNTYPRWHGENCSQARTAHK